MENSEEKAKKSEKSDEIVINIRKNPWMISTIVLGVLLVAFIVYSRSGVTGNTISSDAMGQKAVNFINTQLLQGKGSVTLDSVVEKSGLYEVTVDYNGNKVPVYFTKDGVYFIQGINQINSASSASAALNSQPASVPKSDKPTAEAYVFAYCPYGLQFEKALSSVYQTLKSKADISVVFIGAMHGEFEHQESLRQLCIQKNYGTDKLWQYLDKFTVSSDIGNCANSAYADSCTGSIVDGIMSSLGIDKAKITSCMPTDGETLYKADQAKASAAGVSGSHTFAVNGVQVNVGRSSSEIQAAICSAFNNAPSVECSKALSSTQTSAGFGASTGAASSSSAPAANCATPPAA